MADTNDTAERWLPVVGYEGIYSVSDMGRVRSERDGYRTFKGKLLACAVNGDGYRAVTLPGKPQRQVCVHTLVARAFIGERPAGQQVNHRDGVKLNNNVTNLEYVSPGDNTRHAIAAGLRNNSGDRHWSRRQPEKFARVIAAMQAGDRRRRHLAIKA